jgi:hypothetical protein
MSADKRKWQQLAELAAHEKEPEKLRSLVRELTQALDHRRHAFRLRNSRPDHSANDFYS